MKLKIAKMRRTHKCREFESCKECKNARISKNGINARRQKCKDIKE